MVDTKVTATKQTGAALDCCGVSISISKPSDAKSLKRSWKREIFISAGFQSQLPSPAVNTGGGQEACERLMNCTSVSQDARMMNEGRRVLPGRRGAGEPGGLRPPGTAIRSSVTGSDRAADGVGVFPMRDPADGSDLLAEPRLQRSRARQNKSISEQREEAKRGQSDVILPLFGTAHHPLAVS